MVVNDHININARFNPNLPHQNTVILSLKSIKKLMAKTAEDKIYFLWQDVEGKTV